MGSIIKFSYSPVDPLSPAYRSDFIWQGVRYDSLEHCLMLLLLGDSSMALSSGYSGVSELYARCYMRYPVLVMNMIRSRYTPTERSGEALLSTVGHRLEHVDSSGSLVDGNWFGIELENIRSELLCSLYSVKVREYTDLEFYEGMLRLSDTSGDIRNEVLGLSKLLPVIFVLSEWLESCIDCGAVEIDEYGEYKMLLDSSGVMTGISHIFDSNGITDLLKYYRSVSDLEAGNIPVFHDALDKLLSARHIIKKLQISPYTQRDGLYGVLQSIDNTFLKD